MNLIVVVDKNWGIGINGGLLASIPEDMKFFRETTTGKVVIMGRKTLLSFPGGKPLSNRTNIMLTTDKGFKADDVIVYNSIEKMLEGIKKYNSNDVFVIGGGRVYKQLLPYCDTAYITKVDYTFNADTYFENLDKDDDWVFEEIKDNINSNGYDVKILKYTRKQ